MPPQRPAKNLTWVRPLVHLQGGAMSAVRDSRPVILCIDDRETQAELEVRKRVLEAEGYRVLLENSARQAMEILHRRHVDLVLTETGVARTDRCPTLAP